MSEEPRPRRTSDKQGDSGLGNISFSVLLKLLCFFSPRFTSLEIYLFEDPSQGPQPWSELYPIPERSLLPLPLSVTNNTSVRGSSCKGFYNKITLFFVAPLGLGTHHSPAGATYSGLR